MITTLRDIERKISIDAPPHLNLLAFVLAIGLTARTVTHIFTAVASDCYPALDNHDVTAQTPVVALREHPSTDLSARLFAVSVGLVGIFMFYRLAAPIGSDLTSMVVVGFVGLNAAVCLGDPLWFAYSKYK